MTLSDLQTEFQVLVPDFPYSSYTSTVLNWFNQAQREVCKKRLILSKRTTPSVAEYGEYDLPDNFIELKRSGLTYDGETLQQATIPQLLDYYGTDYTQLDSGTPKFYLIDGGSLELVPKPDEADKNIELKYWVYANDLSESTDLPFTTGDDDVGYTYNSRLRALDRLLLEYAIGMAKFSLGFYDSSQKALATFFSLLDREAIDLKKQEDLEFNRVGFDPFHLRQINTRQNYSGTRRNT